MNAPARAANTSARQKLEVLERLAAPAASDLPLPRALLVFAHPDDEAIAIGGRLERFGASRFVCVTDGALRDLRFAREHGYASREAYAEARTRESEAALRLAGIAADRIAPFCIDGLDGTLVDQEAALHLPALTRALAREMSKFEPEVVLTHPYEGGHPDHDSCAFGVQTAMQLLGGGRAPVRAEAAFYHSGPQREVKGRFLADLDRPSVVRELSAQEQANKRQRFASFPTQAHILQGFSIGEEQYRLAPRYDFTRPPHAGQLLYEQWNLCVAGQPFDGARFRRLAAAALRELGLDPA